MALVDTADTDAQDALLEVLDRDEAVQEEVRNAARALTPLGRELQKLYERVALILQRANVQEAGYRVRLVDDAGASTRSGGLSTRSGGLGLSSRAAGLGVSPTSQWQEMGYATSGQDTPAWASADHLPPMQTLARMQPGPGLGQFVRLLAEVSLGSGALALIGGTVAAWIAAKRPAHVMGLYMIHPPFPAAFDEPLNRWSHARRVGSVAGRPCRSDSSCRTSSSALRCSCPTTTTLSNQRRILRSTN